ncbi:hypothetical protein GWI33_018050 [Rhynchophorus ferrugineus]|uniref:Uncharacterized protein n=1 Tax=Rhynchophorus ferrugineus TaxID=354439 RepID=A0A834HY01_RHYFE|nr:hypothetical protein GWI33_018050 [Rhynchophorus ferrugineus]
MNSQDKYCIMIFDGMGLDLHLQYYVMDDCIGGSEDQETHSKAAIRDYVNLFMVQEFTEPFPLFKPKLPKPIALEEFTFVKMDLVKVSNDKGTLLVYKDLQLLKGTLTNNDKQFNNLEEDTLRMIGFKSKT